MPNLIILLILLFSISCGIKGKPLPPLSATTQETEATTQKVKKK